MLAVSPWLLPTYQLVMPRQLQAPHSIIGFGGGTESGRILTAFIEGEEDVRRKNVNHRICRRRGRFASSHMKPASRGRMGCSLFAEQTSTGAWWISRGGLRPPSKGRVSSVQCATVENEEIQCLGPWHGEPQRELSPIER